MLDMLSGHVGRTYYSGSRKRSHTRSWRRIRWIPSTYSARFERYLLAFGLPPHRQTQHFMRGAFAVYMRELRSHRDRQSTLFLIRYYIVYYPWNPLTFRVPVVIPVPTRTFGTQSPKPATMRACSQALISPARSLHLLSRTIGSRCQPPRIMLVTTRNPIWLRQIAALTRALLHQHGRLREPSLFYSWSVDIK